MVKKPARAMALLLAVLMACAAIPAYAAGEGSITAEFLADDTPVPGAEFSIWRAADVAGNLTEAFSGVSVDLKADMDASGWAQAAAALAAATPGDAEKTGTTGTDGRVVFTELEDGVYLLTGEPLEYMGKRYLPQPCLVAVPGSDGSRAVTVQPKFEYEDAAAMDTVAYYNGRRDMPAVDGAEIVDEVSYRGLVPGKEYTLKGQAVRKSTGEVADEVSFTFTPEASEGTVLVRFTVDAAGYGGDFIVLLEGLYDGEKEVVSHVDLNDLDQTLPVIPQPHKTEISPGDGERVLSGTHIVYEISYTNPYDHAVEVKIRDPLDYGVDFVSASDGGVYDASTHTVTWDIKEAAPGPGKVRLEVEVNSSAVTAVENGAFVSVDGGPEYGTERPRNPLRETGGLIVEKYVTGDGDRARIWHFLVTLSESLNGTYGGMTFHNGMADVELADGQSVQADGLPEGLAYKVEELEEDLAPYTTSYTGATGQIPRGGVARARFTNRYVEEPEPEPTGSLVVTKLLSGGEADREWHFTVTLGVRLTGRYGNMYFTNGVARLTLYAGQYAVAYGLPDGIPYSVREDEANLNGYFTEAYGADGFIVDGATAYCEFVNTLPSNPGKPDAPDTGLFEKYGLFFGIGAAMMLLAAGIAVIAWKKKR